MNKNTASYFLQNKLIKAYLSNLIPSVIMGIFYLLLKRGVIMNIKFNGSIEIAADSKPYFISNNIFYNREKEKEDKND